MMKALQERNMFKYREKFHKLVILPLAAVMCVFFAGCDAGSNGPETTGLSGGSGYRIELASSFESVAVGANTIFTAVIYEPDGMPIRDGEEVVFASTEKGSFSDVSVSTKGGTAVTTYTAEGEGPAKYHIVSVACHGAIASYKLVVTPENF